MNINERIQNIVDKMFNGNKSAFAKRIKIRPTTISNIIGRDRASKPSSEILENIVFFIPELNADWLLTGKGEMLKQNSENSSRNINNENATIRGIVSTGDNHTSINGGVSVGNDNTSKSSVYEQELI